jgi:hypothetical protein
MSNKKGFLTGLIFKDDGTSEPDPKVGTSTSVFKGAAKVQVTPVQNVSSSQSVQGTADNNFIDQLTATIEQNKLPGQNYFDFKQAIENMKSIGSMSDEQKFQTVYAVLSLQKCTKEVLLSSLEKYILIIQGEKANFDKEMENQYQVKVGSKLAKVDDAKKELESLNKRMADLNAIISNGTQDASAEEVKLRTAEANFKASADLIVNEMLCDKEKINHFIK